MGLASGRKDFFNALKPERMNMPNEFYDKDFLFPSFDQVINQRIYESENLSTQNETFEYLTAYKYPKEVATQESVGDYIELMDKYDYIYAGVTESGGIVYQNGKRVIFIILSVSFPDNSIAELAIGTGIYR